MSKKYEFFIDLDGLGSNWQKYVIDNHYPELTIGQLNQHHRRDELLIKMYRKDPRLFSKLPVINSYRAILDYLDAKGVPWNILTSASSHHTSYEVVRDDKLEYVSQHFDVSSDRVIVTESSATKVQYAKPGRVLIDDFHRNCTEWVNEGGVAIQVSPNDYCIDMLLNNIEMLLAASE